MIRLLSLTRAARLVGEHRAELQKKVQNGEMESFDGKVTVESLLACYPSAQIEDSAEFKRVSQIKDKAFGKRVFERALPEPEVLAARITELSKVLTNNQVQLKKLNEFVAGLWDKFSEIESHSNVETRAILDELKLWMTQEMALATEPGFSNPLAIKNKILSVMTAQVTLQPSQQDFLVEGGDTLLEAAMRAGISVNYGCSGGNCGLCKAKVLSGKVKKTRNHEYPLTEAERTQGYVLLCSNTAVSDMTIEASVTGSVQEIPFQQIAATVKSVSRLNESVVLLHLQTPRTQRLRFLAGQHVKLQVGRVFSMSLPIASCPCDDRNLLFHVHRQQGNLFSDYVFDTLKSQEVVEVEGPLGEFILHEKSTRPLYFLAFDGGFAPIHSLIEHAMSLKAEAINLHWIASNKDYLYLPNIGRAWADALDNFKYSEQIIDFDLRATKGQREVLLLEHLKNFAASEVALVDGDVYLAGPDAAIAIAEQFFLSMGLPKTRVFVDVVK
ncbi:MAG: 2Fe-2S iron-sulfur cluster-binding protein [Gallionellaceae bacterium]